MRCQDPARRCQDPRFRCFRLYSGSKWAIFDLKVPELRVFRVIFRVLDYGYTPPSCRPAHRTYTGRPSAVPGRASRAPWSPYYAARTLPGGLLEY